MKLFKRSLIYMIMINTIIYMLLIAFVSYEAKQTDYDRLSNQLYFDNILILNNAQAVNWEQKLFKGAYRVSVEINEYCRALIIDTSSWMPPMISGYYPSTSEDGLKAVVGKNIYSKKVIEENGANWISLLNQKFEVTGVVGTDYITSSDDVVILFGINFDDLNPLEETIIIDGEDAKYIDYISKNLAIENPEVVVHRGNAKGTSRLTKSSYFYRLLYIETVFLVALTLIIFTKHAYEQYNNTRQVYRLLGIPISQVIMCELEEVLIANLIAIAISVFIGNLMGIFEMSQLNPVLWHGTVVTLFSCTLVFIFLLIDSVHDVNKGHKTGGWLSK